MVDLRRTRKLNTVDLKEGSVIYWMSRDQRVHDNWALLYTIQLAEQFNIPFEVVFCIDDTFPDANARHFEFMLCGLEKVEKTLQKYGIHFTLLHGYPITELSTYSKKNGVGGIVTDFSPLRIGREWRSGLARQLNIPVWEVDAHNIVPCWLTSPKQEFAARTIRPKIHRLLPEFLTEFPSLKGLTIDQSLNQTPINWTLVRSKLNLDQSVRPVTWIKAGEKSAETALTHFTEDRLATYDQNRNDPSLDGQSGLSPYLHYGQLSAQRVALEVEQARAPASAKEAFLEELIIRKELSDNFCFYNAEYDHVNGFPAWAKKTLDAHRLDHRPVLYTGKELEEAQTHDEIWNASQLEMVKTGKMHGYLRMYWAKKILEWSPNPETALKHALHLNDRYSLDGRDPNGYVGIAWSIGGVHDRPWFEREIFGSIRYMSEGGIKRKFDIKRYINNIKSL